MTVTGSGGKAFDVTDMTRLADQPLTGEVSAAAAAVSARLAGTAALGVAFSGGVDSSVLLALAVRSLGAGQVVAVLGVCSPG